MAVLERFDGRAWRPVARFGSIRAADVALDEALAGGMHPDRIRVTEVEPSSAAKVAFAIGVVVAALLAIWWAFVLFGPT
jgi:hypothetical protein